MNTIPKYIMLVLCAIIVLLLLYCLMLKNDRDVVLSELIRLNSQLNVTIKSNVTLKNSVVLLEKKASQNRAYILYLENQRTKISELAMQELEKLKTQD